MSFPLSSLIYLTLVNMFVAGVSCSVPNATASAAQRCYKSNLQPIDQQARAGSLITEQFYICVPL